MNTSKYFDDSESKPANTLKRLNLHNIKTEVKVKKSMYSDYFTTSSYFSAQTEGESFTKIKRLSLTKDGNSPIESVITDRKTNVIKEPSSKNELPAKYFKVKEVYDSSSELDISVERHEIEPTPLESQVLKLRIKYPRLFLFVECGYRYRFFGHDALLASKILNIAVAKDRRLLSASVPTYSGPFSYVRKIIDHGYKVGLVSQSSSDSGLFERNLTQIYSSATFFEDDNDAAIENSEGIMAIYGNKKILSFVYYEPKTGRLMYETFDDNRNNSILSSKLSCHRPLEILYPIEELSLGVMEALKRYADSVLMTGCVQIQPSKYFDYLYLEKSLSAIEESNLFKLLSRASSNVHKCLGALLMYLSDFDLHHNMLRTENIVNLINESDKGYMKMNTSTLNSLHVFPSKDYQSLFKLMNQTNTKFGSRTLRHWLSTPLVNKNVILLRQATIKALASSSEYRKLLEYLLDPRYTPDLESYLMKTSCQRIKSKDFLKFISCLVRISEKISAFLSYDSFGIIGKRIKDIGQYLPFSSLKNILNSLDREGSEILNDWSGYPKVLDKRNEIRNILISLDDHTLNIAAELNLLSFQYFGDYLIQVSKNTTVPDNWIIINSTKNFDRYRDPFIIDQVRKLTKLKEELKMDYEMVFKSLLSSFTTSYFHGVQKSICILGELDSFYSLYKVSMYEGYSQPNFNEEKFEVVEGRNPILEYFSASSGKNQYVPNNVWLTNPKGLLLTGPNMGGKSSYALSVALISIMAQVGSWIPAKQSNLPILTSIYMRTGAKDDIMFGKGTLLSECEEVSEILDEPDLSNSLVIMDELGRGTSTLDGSAIAFSVLEYLTRNKNPYVIFISHYKVLFHQDLSISKAYMDYYLEESEVIFLYKLVTGTCEKSFGINVARLANLDREVVRKASLKAHEAQNNRILALNFEYLLQKIAAQSLNYT